MQIKLARIAQFDIAARWSQGPWAAVVRLCFGAACTAAFILTRLLVDLIAPTAGPYALIYPATLISASFGSWRAGLVTYVSAFLWTWYFVIPRVAGHLLKPGDGPRTIVNAFSVLVVLLLAELFRTAVRRAAGERDLAIAGLQAKDAAMRALNENLEQQVAARTRELGQTWNVSPDLLGILSTEGFFESINPAWQTFLDWSTEELRETPFFAFVHPDDVERAHAAWDQINRGDPVFRFETRYRRRDGTWRWLSWVVVPEGGRFYVSARDITDEKANQASLAAAEEALRQSQKLEAVGQLTGGVAHDFNNLLTVILGSVDMLRRDGPVGERRQRHIDAIGNTADRAAKLTRQLLAFARRQTLDPVNFNVGDSLREVVGMIRTLTGPRVEVVLGVPDEPYFVRSDHSQFDTAVVNMSINGRDAMKGQGRLTIAAAPVCEIPALRGHPPVPGNFVAVTIQDTGPGIAPEVADRVFEPFFTTKGVGEGTGLGLSQVFGFAKQSGGDIGVSSQDGEGATFTLYLPRAEPATISATAQKVDEGAHNGNGICVLVVEDNEQVGSFATQSLQELGYCSVLAADAEEALAQLEQNCARFQIVFSDVIMPGMTGIELGTEIRRLYPDVPVLLTSGYSHILAQDGCQGFDLLQKPYSLDQLSHALQTAIGRQAIQKQAP